VAGRIVAVVDVLRASTTIAVALANGAKQFIPFESPEEAVRRSKSFERTLVLLAGERRMHVIPGFDLGNSPREFTADAVQGRTILFTTTNGTGAMLGLAGARDVLIASYVNFSAVLSVLRAAMKHGVDVSILCAGHERHFSLEDAACAGRFARLARGRLTRVEHNDAALACLMIDRQYDNDIAQLLAASAHGRALAAAGFAEDVALCGAIDAFPVVPVYHDRLITKQGPAGGS
jgi:2-phosphosulfolactate phosphatase